MFYNVVGIRFKPAGKIYYFDPGDLHLAVGDGVIVETSRGVEYGTVVIDAREVPEDEVVGPLKKVLRTATDEDYERLRENKAKEKKAFDICLEKIAAHELPMKLVDVEQTFDGNKIIFYFTADGRIDFRELVKDLAAVFRIRIELRQIGVRDEAKMMGGLGCCGRELCCASWLADFASVSIRMAKDQNLSLNPTKISGICGRLMCCLKFENESYEQAKERFPEPGKRVITPDGDGRVSGINIFKDSVSVELRESKLVKEYPLRVIKVEAAVGDQIEAINTKNEGTGVQGPGPAGRDQKPEKSGRCAGNRKCKAKASTGPGI
ncbi:PSP1 domain-containing protein [Desulfoscipio geothermicus]|uniref:Cell fate regulator YaaT, PSP1 superfamily (Controls sporulation, competence, biofilm development) n=1 Tax=Desulfoscipio geothermicus DSM 3669 TaxID=1121426 RepID=A0A1I6DFX0_9FIRM|nr:stage 0 sporulation family protein [Desulfoscipio geothermicus]SFR04222.1 Cell fate regulator YaaT, PSP1 superfamily (controls sporulation, competence, biofilm development) [Desulfoscipio geothermicus DSM 3669]